MTDSSLQRTRVEITVCSLQNGVQIGHSLQAVNSLFHGFETDVLHPM